LKVLYFIDNLDSGGTQRQLVLLLNHLDPARVDATLCTYQPERDFFRSELNEEIVRVVSIPKSRRLQPRFVASLVRFLRRERFDVVHSFLRSSNVWGCLAGRLAGIPAVLVSERRARFGLSTADRWVTPWVHRLADHVALNSAAARERLLAAWKLPKAKTTVIYNGIPELGPVGPPPGDGFVLTMIATFAPNKNHLALVRAFDAAYPTLPRPCALRLVGNEGDGAVRSEIEQFVAGRPCASAIEFLGRRHDIAGLLQASHALVLPSFSEAFPNVLIEALLCERPVLASRVDEHPFIVGDDERGRLFDPAKPASLEAAIRALAETGREERARMGRRGREWARARFSVPRMVEETVQLYEQLLERHRKGREN
jgi:glycosyltransferase involved in cell wall biosynthesis